MRTFVSSFPRANSAGGRFRKNTAEVAARAPPAVGEGRERGGGAGRVRGGGGEGGGAGGAAGAGAGGGGAGVGGAAVVVEGARGGIGFPLANGDSRQISC